jgi:hypothetical protein
MHFSKLSSSTVVLAALFSAANGLNILITVSGGACWSN